MGWFGGKGTNEPEEKPQQCRVKVLNNDGRVLFEKVAPKDNINWDGDSRYIEIETGDGRETNIMTGQYLVVMEDL
ncbi:MAG: hypothetical protein Q8P76_01685 [bacterium]|nr:hypothetical protein [bacterium]